MYSAGVIVRKQFWKAPIFIFVAGVTVTQVALPVNEFAVIVHLSLGRSRIAGSALPRRLCPGSSLNVVFVNMSFVF
jgi:hypothetical protein